jgi:gas vesicle protein
MGSVATESKKFYSNQLERVAEAARQWKEATFDRYSSHPEIDHVAEKLKEAVEDLELLADNQEEN